MKAKKLLAALLAATALAAGLMLTACGPTPEEEITTGLSAAFDPIAAGEEEAVNAIADSMSAATEQLASYGIDPIEYTKALIDGLTYEIVGVTVAEDGETATAEVTLNCKSFSEAATIFQGKIETLANSAEASTMTEDEIQKKLGELFMESLGEVSPRETTCEFTFELVDGAWTMADNGDQVIANAFLA